MRLADRVVFVTGASRGIGRAVALACARAGADLVLAARTFAVDNPRLPGTLQEVAAAVEALGRRALPIQLDVRDDAACEAAVAEAIERFGRVDALVNNAGARWHADVVETKVLKFDQVLGVNLRAAFVLSRAVLPHFLERKYGHVVMMSPPVAPGAAAHDAVHAVSKFGMTMLASAIAEEVRDCNVTAHALWPATAIETAAAEAPELCRKPEILGDAVVALLAREPSARAGRAWIDEELLREEGVTSFERYQCVPGVEPPHFPFSANPRASKG